MANTLYAWSPIRHGDDDGKVTVIKVGQKVSASDLDMSEEEFQGFIDSGAVRPRKYPDIHDSVSPMEHFKQAAADAAAGNYDNVLAETEDEENTEPEKKTGWAK